jgi:hypothetical protein
MKIIWWTNFMCFSNSQDKVGALTGYNSWDWRVEKWRIGVAINFSIVKKKKRDDGVVVNLSNWTSVVILSLYIWISNCLNYLNSIYS